MFVIKTDSPMFAPSVPRRAFKSFVRAADTMRRTVIHRADDYGYGLKESLAYELSETEFVIEFIDDFGFIHSFSVVGTDE